MSESSNRGCTVLIVVVIILSIIGYFVPEPTKNWECCCSISESAGGTTFGGYRQCDNYYDITKSEAEDKCTSETFGVTCNLYEK